MSWFFTQSLKIIENKCYDSHHFYFDDIDEVTVDLSKDKLIALIIPPDKHEITIHSKYFDIVPQSWWRYKSFHSKR